MRIDDTANVDQAKTSFAGTEKVDYEDWNLLLDHRLSCLAGQRSGKGRLR